MNTSDILSKHLCGFNLSLKKGIDEDVAMGSIYRTFMGTIHNSPEFTPGSKVFPVVFHVLTHGGVDIYPSGVLDFDPAYILRHVNYWFEGTGISFAPAEINPQGQAMPVPGLNIIDGNNVTETRAITGFDGSFVHTYRNDMVAITPDFKADIETPGVTLESIYTTYRWSIPEGERYLNIFVVNRLKAGPQPAGKDSSVYISSEHPYVAEQLDTLPIYNCAVEFSGLGRSYFDTNGDAHVKGEPTDVETNFGYNYISKDALDVDYPAYTFKGGSGNIEGFRDRGRSLAHSLGHMLGLVHPKTEFDTPGSSCGSGQVLSDTLNMGGAFIDDLPDTEPTPSGESGVRLSEFGKANPCSADGDTIFKSAETHMTLSQRSGIIDTELGGPSIRFTSAQAMWMHANCELQYYNEEAAGLLPGVLMTILSNSTYAIPPTVTDPCAPVGNVDPRLINSKGSVSNTPSRTIVIPLGDVGNKTLSFNKLLSSIKKLIPTK